MPATTWSDQGHRGDAEGDKDMALARAGRPDQAQVLFGPDPFKGGEVVQGRAGVWSTRTGSSSSSVLITGNGGSLTSGPCVGGLAGGDLGIDRVRSSSSGDHRLGLSR